MMIISWAIAVDASSADRFVDSPSMIIVRVNFAMSCVATPSWPAFAATLAISVWLADMVVASPRSWPSSASIWSRVPDTVFATPAKSDCHWIAAVVTSARPPAIRVPVRSIPDPTRSQSCRFFTAAFDTSADMSRVAFAICRTFAM